MYHTNYHSSIVISHFDFESKTTKFWELCLSHVAIRDIRIGTVYQSVREGRCKLNESLKIFHDAYLQWPAATFQITVKPFELYPSHESTLIIIAGAKYDQFRSNNIYIYICNKIIPIGGFLSAVDCCNREFLTSSHCLSFRCVYNNNNCSIYVDDMTRRRTLLLTVTWVNFLVGKHSLAIVKHQNTTFLD